MAMKTHDDLQNLVWKRFLELLEVAASIQPYTPFRNMHDAREATVDEVRDLINKRCKDSAWKPKG